MRVAPSLLAFLFLVCPFAVAQTTAYSVAVFGPTATNPATATPVAAAVVYPLASAVCNQAKVTEVLPIVNPHEGRFDDPSNPTTRDCALSIEAQFAALPVGTNYKAAYRPLVGATPGAWSPLSTPFAVVAQTHPCDGAAPSTGSVQEGSRTIAWCFSDQDTNGTPTVVSNWAIYVDGVRAVLSGVSVGSTTNAAGLRQYQAAVTLARGTRVVQIAGVNAIGEAVKSASFTSTVTAAPAVPAVSFIRGIQ